MAATKGPEGRGIKSTPSTHPTRTESMTAGLAQKCRPMTEWPGLPRGQGEAGSCRGAALGLRGLSALRARLKRSLAHAGHFCSGRELPFLRGRRRYARLQTGSSRALLGWRQKGHALARFSAQSTSAEHEADVGEMGTATAPKIPSRHIPPLAIESRWGAALPKVLMVRAQPAPAAVGGTQMRGTFEIDPDELALSGVWEERVPPAPVCYRTPGPSIGLRGSRGDCCALVPPHLRAR